MVIVDNTQNHGGPPLCRMLRLAGKAQRSLRVSVLETLSTYTISVLTSNVGGFTQGSTIQVELSRMKQ
jgi:hypothetical protein